LKIAHVVVEGQEVHQEGGVAGHGRVRHQAGKLGLRPVSGHVPNIQSGGICQYKIFSRDISVENIQAVRIFRAHNIQLVRMFQYKLFSQ
jgi:hypothetical protein